MKIQELSAGDVFYTCWARTKTVTGGPFRLEGSFQLELRQLPIYKVTRVVDRSAKYLLGQVECIKVGSIPDESC